MGRLREGRAICMAKNEPASQVTPSFQRRSEPHRHGDQALPSAFRRSYDAVPRGAAHGQRVGHEVDVAPLERDELSLAKAGLRARDEERSPFGVVLYCGEKAFEFVEL